MRHNYNIAIPPLYFVRSGDIVTLSGHLRFANSGGYFWSFSASSKHYSGGFYPSTYFLDFNTSEIYPSDGPSYRWYGFPLRRLGSGGGDQIDARQKRY